MVIEWTKTPVGGRVLVPRESVHLLRLDMLAEVACWNRDHPFAGTMKFTTKKHDESYWSFTRVS